jgi:hypothetical protein
VRVFLRAILKRPLIDRLVILVYNPNADEAFMRIGDAVARRLDQEEAQACLLMVRALLAISMYSNK